MKLILFSLTPLQAKNGPLPSLVRLYRNLKALFTAVYC